MFTVFVYLMPTPSLVCIAGHSTSPHSPFIVLISMGFVCLYTFVPLNVEWQLLPSSDGKSDEVRRRVSESYGMYSYTTSHALPSDYPCL